MQQIDNSILTDKQTEALSEIKHKLEGHFDVDSMVLFGSIVRGEADTESDIDLLVLTANKLDRTSRHEITDLIFEINLKYDTNFSTLVVDSQTWETGLISVLPIRDEVLSEGMAI
jgi:predicted nucleotidyltransferase